jgi:PAT family beta-lactamase induction signal transducer AmpG
MSDAQRPGTWASLARALSSWRTAAVTLLSFSSGLPYAVVVTALPDWLRSIGVDLTTVGVITLSQAPWAFKFVWSPLMDRWPLPLLGRRRGWIAVAQLGLLALTLAFAGCGSHPDTPWVVGSIGLAMAFAAATQDIAYDAYAVDVLTREEQGVAVGARQAVYRAAMFIAGGVAISLAGRLSWPVVFVGLAVLYLPLLLVTARAPEPPVQPAAPRTVRDAVWLPFLGFLSRHRALEILAFVVCYKLADNLGSALLRPFLVDMGYSADDRGFALSTIGLAATLVGTFLGGSLTAVLGLGRALWLFGALQIVSNVGYVLLCDAGVDRPLMYAAMGFETATNGLGNGAFGVLLMRLTQARFSATQYALFSSMFRIPSLLTGPLAGVVADSLGWKVFFYLTMVAGLPGLLLLQRFVPVGVREPELSVEAPVVRAPLSRAGLWTRGLAGAGLGLVAGTPIYLTMAALRALRGQGVKLAASEVLARLPSELAAAWGRLLHPATPAQALPLLGLLVFAVACGFVVAAASAARHGARTEVAGS